LAWELAEGGDDLLAGGVGAVEVGEPDDLGGVGGVGKGEVGASGNVGVGAMAEFGAIGDADLTGTGWVRDDVSDVEDVGGLRCYVPAKEENVGVVTNAEEVLKEIVSAQKDDGAGVANIQALVVSWQEDASLAFLDNDDLGTAIGDLAAVQQSRGRAGLALGWLGTVQWASSERAVLKAQVAIVRARVVDLVVDLALSDGEESVVEPNLLFSGEGVVGIDDSRVGEVWV